MFFLPKSISSVRRTILQLVAFIVVAAMASVLLAMASVLPATASPRPSETEDSQSFSGGPADGDYSDSTRTRFTFGADPGQSISDFYYIENTGTLPQDVTVYATDAFNAEDGTFSLLDGNAAPAGVGAWVSLDGSPRQVITLAPRSSKVIPLTINIPATARPGDHVGGIIASVTSADGQVKLERRVATRLYVRVSGELQPGLTVGGLATTYQPNLNPFNGKVVFSYSVKNTGNVALSATSVSTVSGIFGIRLSGFTTSTMPELLPDGTHVMTVAVPGVWQWIWMNAKVSLIGTVDKNAPSPGVMPMASREATTWAVPWALLVLLMAAAFVFLYVRFSRMNNERRSQQWLEYTEAEARLRAREETPKSSES